MSRTDKDSPWWVNATWWEPEHRHRCTASTTRYPIRPCDLPDRPVITHEQARREQAGLQARSGEPHCVWDPVWSYDAVYHRHVPRWYVHHRWTNPHRRQGRDDCRRAAAEYRATGDVDVIPDTAQHRHGARWDWD